MKSFLTFSLTLVMVLMLGTSAFAAATTVDDKAGLFKPETIESVNRMIEEAYRLTQPHKDIVVETMLGLPDGFSNADDYIESRFRSRGVDGVYILLVLSPTDKSKGTLRVGLGTETKKRFSNAMRNDVVARMMTELEKKRFDAAILTGVSLTKEKLTALFEPNRPPVATGYTESPVCGGNFWTILFIVVGVWLLLGVIRALFTVGQTPSPNQAAGGYGAPGYAPSAGGGFGSALLGGLFGAMAGNYLYHSMFGGSSHPVDSGHSNTPISDNGSFDSASGGDFGGDSSGGDGGDFGGGGDF